MAGAIHILWIFDCEWKASNVDLLIWIIMRMQAKVQHRRVLGPCVGGQPVRYLARCICVAALFKWHSDAIRCRDSDVGQYCKTPCIGVFRICLCKVLDKMQECQISAWSCDLQAFIATGIYTMQRAIRMQQLVAVQSLHRRVVRLLFRSQLEACRRIQLPQLLPAGSEQLCRIHGVLKVPDQLGIAQRAAPIAKDEVGLVASELVEDMLAVVKLKIAEAFHAENEQSLSDQILGSLRGVEAHSAQCALAIGIVLHQLLLIW
mmetsp:Transcript_105647/g.202899  ORF Transcript_105647/g.202899 Transcript_105647/m.202899 type:complete len:261 (+) Transcript_105647:1745-2527(+)